jgi:NDP-sugar pyrophosphorylase family protein
MVPVLGAPFVSWQLSWLATHGIEKVTLSVGYRGRMIREYVGDGRRWGLTIDYVDEGANLRGTAGALRLAFDLGALEESYFLLYGDSFLPVDMDRVMTAWQRSGRPALMTVMRNQNRWDLSNVVVAGDQVLLYDKKRPADRVGQMHWIDYGLSILSRDIIRDRVPTGLVADVADLLRDISIDGDLAALEVDQRFYEIGSAEGLTDLERYLGTLGRSL